MMQTGKFLTADEALNKFVSAATDGREGEVLLWPWCSLSLCISHPDSETVISETHDDPLSNFSEDQVYYVLLI